MEPSLFLTPREVASWIHCAAGWEDAARTPILQAAWSRSDVSCLQKRSLITR